MSAYIYVSEYKNKGRSFSLGKGRSKKDYIFEKKGTMKSEGKYNSEKLGRMFGSGRRVERRDGRGQEKTHFSFV